MKKHLGSGWEALYRFGFMLRSKPRQSSSPPTAAVWGLWTGSKNAPPKAAGTAFGWNVDDTAWNAAPAALPANARVGSCHINTPTDSGGPVTFLDILQHRLPSIYIQFHRCEPAPSDIIIIIIGTAATMRKHPHMEETLFIVLVH